MKPFLAFHGPGQLPMVAVRNLVGTFPTLFEAEQSIELIQRSDSGNWAEICDSNTWTVLRSGTQEGAVADYSWTWRDALSRGT